MEAADDKAPSRLRLASRLGLAIVNPKWALAVAGDRRHAGRSGSDLIVMITVLLLATRLRPLVEQIWIGVEVGAGYGLRAVTNVLTRTLIMPLAVLIIGALLLFAIGGKRRNAGRAFDLACVAILPMLFVEIAATFVVRTLDVRIPFTVAWGLSLVAYAWAGALFALAVRTARTGGMRVPEPPSEITRLARRTGAGVLAIAAIACAIQVVWIARNVEHVRPVTNDVAAPQFALPTIIDEQGRLGPPRELAALRGKIVILDFWATWCGPCIKALPRLDRVARSGDDIEVLAINLDDRASAFELWTARGYQMTLLADDDTVSARYGVGSIPHTVVIDHAGVVRHVSRGAALDSVEAIVEQIRK
jgi:thiol-disulfide isomerase/thioredoxin